MSATTIKKIKTAANNVSTTPSGNCRKQIFLNQVDPCTPAQELTFDAFKRGKNLVLAGSAGTGKTFLSLYLSLRAISNNLCDQRKVVIVRSAVPTRDLGALPGDLGEKTGIYELPYYSILTELTGNINAYGNLKCDNVISFVPTSYLRGVTFRDSIIILDEGQNCTYPELYTVMTRAGENCKFIFCGDMKQDDLIRKQNDRSGFGQFMKVVSDIPSFEMIGFGHEDIVRGDICKDFIIASEKYGY